VVVVQESKSGKKNWEAVDESTMSRTTGGTGNVLATTSMTHNSPERQQPGMQLTFYIPGRTVGLTIIETL